MALPPGPRAPAAINLARYVRRPVETVARWQRRYGDVFTLKLTAIGTGVYVADPAAIRELFTGDQSDLRAGEANSFLEHVLGPQSLLVLDGDPHMRQRKLLLPQLHGSRMDSFREDIREATGRELSSWVPGRRLVLRERMRAITFEVICRAVLGVADAERIRLLRSAVVALIDSSPVYWFVAAARADRGRFSPGRRFARRKRAAATPLLDEIARRRVDPELEQLQDVLSLLLRTRDDEGDPITDSELHDMLLTMLAAGYETTATCLSFAFELLLANPRACERLREEILADDGDAYLDAVVKETLRLRPAIDNTERTLTKPRTVAGFELPAGVKVYPGIVLVHLREDLYPRAKEFRPERFLEPSPEPYAWLPFGGGIRRCVGAPLAQAEIAEVLRTAIPAMSLRLVRNRPDPVVLQGITLAPKHGVEVEVMRAP